ncbi:MAG: ACP S-malonyltransferase [Treponemataceae bacterium]|nr:ACP S-malonyltransferase [Treponemataceae bacterium]
MQNVFLFPGQGSQFQGMMMDLYESSSMAKKTIDKFSELSGEDIVALLRDTDISVLSRTDKSQLAITAASLAMVAALKEKGIEPDAVAGFSLGEFSALCVSGILSFEDTVKIVKVRGEIMQKVCDEIASCAGEGEQPGMAAVLGLTPDVVQNTLGAYGDVSKEEAVFPTNLNSPKQTVVSGTAKGLAVAEKLCKEAGAKRVVVLKVAGPFHSPLMEKAATQFASELEKVAFNEPKIKCFSNVTGKAVVSGGEAKANAVEHIVKAVRWTEEESAIAAFAENFADDWRLLEVGPGKTLCGLWRDSGFGDKAECLPVGTLEQFAALS